MMNQYAEIFDETPATAQFSSSIEELKTFCQGITQRKQPAGHCELERGYLVAYGQEFRTTLIRGDNGYKLVLLRAYVPLDDYPVMLDTYAEEMVECKNLPQLKEELTKFLRLSHVRDQIEEWLR